MSDFTPWPLIAKYLAGECSPEEKAAMEWWLEEPGNYELYQQIKTAWQQEKEPSDAQHFDTEKGLTRLHALIGPEEEPAETQDEKRFRYIKLSSWLAAAMVAVLIGIGYVFVGKTNEKKDATRITYAQKKAGKDKIEHVTLPDGSEVWLNKNSKIEYPTTFVADKREVYLEGEAFFEVVRNPASPFFVRSKKVSTQVLGTSFNVRAYRNEETAAVTVATGKVEVSKEIEKGEPIRITQLTPQQELVINTEKDETYIDIVSLYDVGAWRKEQLVFRNNRYADVVAKLEEHYGIKIMLKDKALYECRVMASFNEGASLREVLKLLSISNSFRYTISGNQVTITGGACR